MDGGTLWEVTELQQPLCRGVMNKYVTKKKINSDLNGTVGHRWAKYGPGSGPSILILPAMEASRYECVFSHLIGLKA